MKLTPINTAVYTSFYNDIVDFRNTFKLPVNTPANYQTEDEALHDSLYLEELLETFNAENEVKRADGIIDAMYVTFGKLVHKGLRSYGQMVETPLFRDLSVLYTIGCKKFTEEKLLLCWAEVHRSNLSKVCPDAKDRDATMKKYKALGVKVRSEKCDKGYIVKVAEDCEVGEDFYPKDKVLKSVSYSEANLAAILSQNYALWGGLSPPF